MPACGESCFELTRTVGTERRNCYGLNQVIPNRLTTEIEAGRGENDL
jgi:hypothetical protein